MSRASASLLVSLAGFSGLAGAIAAPAPSAPPANPPTVEVRLNGHTFTLPAGFRIEVAAANELVPRPIAGSFDPEGRLYVTDSSGSNLPPAEQLKDPRGRILRLEDTDGDGRFDRTTEFADRVMFPQGCLWHGGSVYVAGPPSIWKFTDTDGDGRADQRTEWYQGKVLTGCANDVHGPYLGPEGMLYWTKGAFARLDLKDRLGRPINDRCAHVFRAWPDGSGFETVMSGGMDNPVEVAFTAEGEPVVISTFIDLSQPGRRDGLAHAVYGGVFGKINDVVDEPMVRRTGGLMPVLSQYGPAAACALMRYEGDAFGPAYRDNLFGTLFNLRKVTRHVLRPAGASYASEDSDFLVSDQIDFRPTDVLEDVDGSLLVVDTGGWYKLCCPSSQLAKADVLGAIYRVRREGAPDRRPAVAEARKAAYTRLAGPPGLREPSPEVELKRLALKAEPRDAARLRSVLAAQLPRLASEAAAARVVRVAAEGLGRMRDSAAVPLLLEALALAAPEDRFLEHSLLYALIETGAAEAVRPYLASDKPGHRRAATLVLEQIGDGTALKPADVLGSLASTDPALRETALWVARRHAEWSGEIAGHVRAQLARADLPAGEVTSWEGLLALLARRAEGQTAVAEVATLPTYRSSSREAAFQAMAGAGLKEVPAPWKKAIVGTLDAAAAGTSGGGSLGAAMRAARSMPWPKEGDPDLTASLLRVSRAARVPDAQRVEALGLLPAGSAVGTADFAVLRSALAPDRPPGERLSAATAVGRLRPGTEQLRSLLDAVAAIGPLELPRLLAAFGGCSDEAVGRDLLAALRGSKALSALRPEDLKTPLAKFPDSIREGAEVLLASIRSDASQERARLDAVLAEVSKLDGQVRRGQSIFNGTKAACASCHRLGYLGGDLGPDLTSIGTVRTDRDLLEAVLFPSASLVRSYESWVAVAKDGEEYSGVLRRDTPEEVVIATGPGAETRIRRADLVELRLGSLSIMPAGLDEQLSRQELADLLAFLKNTKWGVN
jgi:putative membrane-bound dehydrogenase-like protein